MIGGWLGAWGWGAGGAESKLLGGWDRGLMRRELGAEGWDEGWGLGRGLSDGGHSGV